MELFVVVFELIHMDIRGPIGTYYLRGILIPPYRVEKHHMKIQKCPSDSGNASPDAPHTYTIHSFFSHTSIL